jgi:hypothetical protein
LPAEIYLIAWERETLPMTRLQTIALLGSWIAALGIVDGAGAATITITGVPFSTPSQGVGAFPGYGTDINKNNVVNFSTSGGSVWPSGLRDTTNGTAWRVEGNTIASAVFSNVANYEIDWYFNGAESG